MEDEKVGLTALEAMPLFADVTRHDLENILKLGDLRSFEPGETIVERGSPSDALYVILRGTAQVDVGGRYHDMKPGEFFGEMGVITGRKRMATVKAADRLDALRIGAAELENFLLHQPRVALAMMKSLVERLREVQERIDAWAGVW
ncbi:MAG: cyclic nucleotide-binding domain-containing protein [Actinobacteria bacterium]|nr:MAG: cyclic nucleotide-binding domain-containing protein [Actinomycetota bacterium]